jgi:hypothetical protein
MCAFRWFVNGAKDCRAGATAVAADLGCVMRLCGSRRARWGGSQLAFPPAQRFKLMVYVPDSNINGTTPITIDSPGATVLFWPP